MEFNLSEIAEAFWATGANKDDKEERRRIYDRARMLRDAGLIQTSSSTRRGSTTKFTEADIAAAVVALWASFNGHSRGAIQAINMDLRAIGNTQGRPEYEFYIEQILAGKPIFVRLDFFSTPFSFQKATMGGPEVLALSTAPNDSAKPIAPGTTEIAIWPVTAIAKPVLDYLLAQKN